jgi:hypothetical protein
VSSTNARPVPSWRQAGHRYHSYSHFLKSRFGERVHKVSLDAGLTCPNVDGTVAVGGCVFCDNESFSPSRRLARRSIADQLQEGIRRISRRVPARKFIAYFQPGTNTYAPVEKLKRGFLQALDEPRVVGLAVGTRPDCLPEPVLDLLTELARSTWLSVELGLQSIHDRSLDWMNRGHHHHHFVDAVERSRGRGFHIGAHVILGLPGESHDDMMATAAEVARLRLDSVKLHNLYAVKDTPLALDVEAGRIQLWDRGSYVRTAVDFLERIPSDCVVERLHGDSPPAYLVGPSWCLDRPALLAAIRAELESRDTWQGRLFSD